MREAKASRLFSRIKVDTPGPWQYRSQQPHSIPPTPQHSPIADPDADILQSAAPLNDRKLNDSNSKDMTLADITDFSLRSMVAQLMTVAPALPVGDLYHLVIDSKGHLPTARRYAIRMSEAPIACRQSVRSPLHISSPLERNELMTKSWSRSIPTIQLSNGTQMSHHYPSSLQNRKCNHPQSQV
jgi:hypothetical protein